MGAKLCIDREKVKAMRAKEPLTPEAEAELIQEEIAASIKPQEKTKPAEPKKKGKRSKIVSAEELADYIDEGWEAKFQLNDGRVLICFS